MGLAMFNHGRLGLAGTVLAVSSGLGQLTLNAPATRPQAEPSKVAADVKPLEWMAGSWVDESGGSGGGGRRSEEHWTQPAGGTMIGMNRTVAGDRTVFFEYLRIEIRSGEVLYVASPRGRQPATLFKLIETCERRAVFENPEHDFPQRIIYERKGEELHARIEGTVDGKKQSESWKWMKVKE